MCSLSSISLFCPKSITSKPSDVFFNKQTDSDPSSMYSVIRTALKVPCLFLNYREKDKQAEVVIQVFEKPNPYIRINDHILASALHFIIRLLKPKTFAGGNLVFTQDQGITHLKGTTPIQVIKRLSQGFPRLFDSELKRRIGLLALSTEIKESEVSDVKMSFGSGGFFYTEPAMILEIPKHWKIPEDYINDLSSKYKNRIKQILRRSHDLKAENASLSTIKHQQNSLKKLYNNVLKNSKTRLVNLPEDYFVKLKTSLPENFFIRVYYLKNEIVGFISFAVGGKQLNAHLVGLDYFVVRENALYNRILLDLVFIAIEKKVERVNFARTATEIKSTLGAKPHIKGVLIKTNSLIINCLLSIASYFNHPPVFTIRHPFKKNNS